MAAERQTGKTLNRWLLGLLLVAVLSLFSGRKVVSKSSEFLFGSPDALEDAGSRRYNDFQSVEKMASPQALAEIHRLANRPIPPEDYLGEENARRIGRLISQLDEADALSLLETYDPDWENSSTWDSLANRLANGLDWPVQKVDLRRWAARQALVRLGFLQGRDALALCENSELAYANVIEGWAQNDVEAVREVFEEALRTGDMELGQDAWLAFLGVWAGADAEASLTFFARRTGLSQTATRQWASNAQDFELTIDEFDQLDDYTVFGLCRREIIASKLKFQPAEFRRWYETNNGHGSTVFAKGLAEELGRYFSGELLSLTSDFPEIQRHALKSMRSNRPGQCIRFIESQADGALRKQLIDDWLSPISPNVYGPEFCVFLHQESQKANLDQTEVFQIQAHARRLYERDEDWIPYEISGLFD